MGLEYWCCVIVCLELPESIGIYLLGVVSFPGCVQSGNEVSVFLRQCDSSKSSRKRRFCWEGRLVGPLDGRWLEGGSGERERERGGGERREREKGRERREGEGERGRGRESERERERERGGERGGGGGRQKVGPNGKTQK